MKYSTLLSHDNVLTNSINFGISLMVTLVAIL